MKLKPGIKLNDNSKQTIISFRILEDIKKNLLFGRNALFHIALQSLETPQNEL